MAPGFPYVLLVRVPLLTLSPYALTRYFQVTGIYPILPSHFWAVPALQTATRLFYIGMGLQLYAVPAGMIAMYLAGERTSLKHWLALFCGISYLALQWLILDEFAHAIRR